MICAVPRGDEADGRVAHVAEGGDLLRVSRCLSHLDPLAAYGDLDWSLAAEGDDSIGAGATDGADLR